MPSQGQGFFHLGGPGPQEGGEVLLPSHQWTRTMNSCVWEVASRSVQFTGTAGDEEDLFEQERLLEALTMSSAEVEKI